MESPSDLDNLLAQLSAINSMDAGQVAFYVTCYMVFLIKGFSVAYLIRYMKKL